MPGEKSARRRGVLLVLVATVLWSLAGLFARLLVHLDVWTVMGWRALLGAASIAAVGLIEWRNGRLDNPLGFGALSPLVALLAMIAISAYTASVMTTTIADAKHDGLARLGRDRKRAERPVPEGERKAEVLVEMCGIDGVMQLVMGRTLQDPAEIGRAHV